MAGRKRPFCPVMICVLAKKGAAYSITSSAVATSVGGTVRSSALAVLRLITSAIFVICDRFSRGVCYV